MHLIHDPCVYYTRVYDWILNIVPRKVLNYAHIIRSQTYGEMLFKWKKYQRRDNGTLKHLRKFMFHSMFFFFFFVSDNIKYEISNILHQLQNIFQQFKKNEFIKSLNYLRIMVQIKVYWVIKSLALMSFTFWTG